MHHAERVCGRDKGRGRSSCRALACKALAAPPCTAVGARERGAEATCASGLLVHQSSGCHPCNAAEPLDWCRERLQQQEDPWSPAAPPDQTRCARARTHNS